MACALAYFSSVFKKVLIAVVVLALLAVTYVTLFPKKQAAPKQAAPKRTAVTKPWNGALTTSSAAQATFVRGQQVMTVKQIAYSGLDTATASAVVTMAADKPSNNKPPLWMTTPDQITARSVVGTTYKPVTKIADRGSTYQETLIFRNLPVAQLVRQQIGLIVRSQAGPFSLGLTPPPAPAGHSYAEKLAQPGSKTLDSKPSIAYTGKRVARHKVVIKVFARAHGAQKLLRLTVSVDGKRKIRPGRGNRASAAVKITRKGRHTVLAVARDTGGQLSKTLRISVRVR